MGLSYATLYAKYKDRFGPLNAKRHKHLVPYNNNQPRTAPEKKEFSLGSLNIIEYNEYSGKRDEFWREHFVSVLMNVSTNSDIISFIPDYPRNTDMGAIFHGVMYLRISGFFFISVF